jgi:tellurite resistance protein TerC
MDSTTLWLWGGFHVFLLAVLALDLGVFHRKSHAVGFREAMVWTGVWIALAFVFNIGVYYWMGEQRAVEFLTGYLIEKSLSIDNIFVILLIFTYFRIPPAYQHKVLFWGILGALFFRLVFIMVGIELIMAYHWVLYVFGAFLVFTGIRIMLPHPEPDLQRNFGVRLLRKLIPVTSEYDGAKFFTRIDKKLAATPLFAALIAVESTDIVFAVDSIPAILAISTDRFIVYASNAFAILGLRSLYFAVAKLWDIFVYLKYGLGAILIFVGTKMLLAHYIKLPPFVALLVIGLILGTTVVASIIASRKQS